MNQAVFQWLSNLLRRACKIPFQHGTKSVLMLAGVVVVGLWVLVQWALVPRRTDAPLGYPQGESSGLVFYVPIISNH